MEFSFSCPVAHSKLWVSICAQFPDPVSLDHADDIIKEIVCLQYFVFSRAMPESTQLKTKTKLHGLSPRANYTD
jgi:hypothetical protein